MTENRTSSKSFHPAGTMATTLSRGMRLLSIACLVAGCTAITDFDESRIKINLYKVLFEENIVFQTVDDVGYITLPFATPFDAGDRDSFDALMGEDITFTVARDGNTVGEEITKTRVDGLPKAPGEYHFGIGRMGQRAVISFYNYSTSSTQPLVVPEDKVTLLIHADANPLFVVKTYAFNITIHAHTPLLDSDSDSDSGNETAD